MADINNKVVVEFDDLYDSNDDGVINLSSNVIINKVCNDIDDLYSLNTSLFPLDRATIVYVKNIATEKDTYNYRGAFYQWDPASMGWQQILIGQHSHANKEILDKISNINTDTLSYDTEYCLKIVKVESDSGEITYDIKYVEDKTQLSLPVDSSTPKYLQSDGTGYQWVSDIAPAQTFKKIKHVLTENDIITPNNISIPCENLTFNMLTDDIMVYDNGVLIDILNAEYLDGRLNIVISNDEFELDETITVLIIRHGISGFIDTIADEYVTKKELVNVLTNGNIDLNKYVLHSELEKYSRKNHTHSDFAKRSHNHDYRYADFKHTHVEYLTRPQVLSIIADAAGIDGDIEITNIIQNLVTSVQNTIDSLINKNYITESELENRLNESFNSINTDNILYNDQKLTDFLNNVDTSKSNSNDNCAQLKYYRVENELGGFSEGDVIYEGMSINEFIKKLFSSKTVKIENGIFTCEIKPLDNVIIGDVCRFEITPNYIQNDFGKCYDIECSIITNTNTTTFMLFNNTSETFSIPVIPSSDSDVFAKIEVTLKYEKSAKCDAGILTYSDEISCVRYAYCGSFDFEFNSDFVDMSEYLNRLTVYNKSDEIVLSDKHHKTLIFAIPTTWDNIKEIIYKEQNTDILDLCEYKTLALINNNVPVGLYTVYIYNFAQPSNSKMHFEIR